MKSLQWVCMFYGYAHVVIVKSQGQSDVVTSGDTFKWMRLEEGIKVTAAIAATICSEKEPSESNMSKY